MCTMTDHRIRHLPVLDDDGQLSGIVSIGDVVKSTITQLQFERDQLQELRDSLTDAAQRPSDDKHR